MSLFGNIGREEWMDDAKCIDLHVQEADALFFPNDPNNNHGAKRFCEGKEGRRDYACPVMAQCLAKALRDGEPYGVWGGKSPRERGAILRKRYEADGVADARRYARALPAAREGVKPPPAISVRAEREGNGCARCAARTVAVTRSENDYERVARRAARSAEANAYYAAEMDVLRGARDEARQQRDLHAAECIIAQEAV